MSERELDEAGLENGSVTCPVCGTRGLAGDRFCAECGTPLPRLPAAEEPSPEEALRTVPLPSAADVSGTAANGGSREREDALWLFGARPTAVIGGGFLLLVLAVALLGIGQIEPTGTVVMLSICLAPLGLLTLVIGMARQLVRVMGRR